MQNLVQNQYGTYTFRRRFGKQSVRVSLKTSNEVEAKRIYFKLQDLFLSHPFLTSDEARHLIKTLLAEMQGRAEIDSRRRLLALLNTQLNPAQSISLSELFAKYKGEKRRICSFLDQLLAPAVNIFLFPSVLSKMFASAELDLNQQ